MSLLEVLLVLVVVGIILWLINTYLPISPSFKKIINVVAALFVIFWLLKGLGAFTYLSGVRV